MVSGALETTTDPVKLGDYYIFWKTGVVCKADYNDIDMRTIELLWEKGKISKVVNYENAESRKS